MGETIQSLPYIGKKIISPEAMAAERAAFAPKSSAESAGQTTGKGAEDVLEFVMGDEALKGLALSDKIGLASQIAKISQTSPYIGALLRHGVTAARSGTVGTAEALAKGATPEQALETGIVTGATGGALEASGEAASKAGGFIKRLFGQVTKGADVAQPGAQSALREGVQGATSLSTAQPQSLRTIAEEPIHTLESSAKGLYRQIDQASGTDFKALNEKLDNTEYQIRQLTETEEDVKKEAALEKSRTAIMDKIQAAKDQAKAAGVDPQILDDADAKFKQARALSDLETKVFKNPSIVQGNSAAGTPETVNVDSAIKQIQKLQDKTKYGGSRLEQALGPQGAKTLIDNLYAAQRQGVKALKYQQVAKWLAGAAGAGAVAGAATEILK